MLGRVLLILFLVLSWLEAAAAPWTLDEGSTYARASIASERVDGLEAWRGDIYVEYGVQDTLTATLKLETVAYPDASDFNADGWRATLRQRVLQVGSWNFTAEIGLLEGAAIGGRNGCDTLGAEGRAGISWSGQWLKRQNFVFVEAVVREHEGCRRQRQEFGFGQQLSENIWSVSQVWMERGAANASSDKVQSELLWRDGRNDYSIGYRKENGGFFVEESIFLAVAKRF